MNAITPGWNRDRLKHRNVIVMGTATVPNTKSIYVVVETDDGLELFKPQEFEESSRFLRADKTVEIVPRFTPIVTES